MKITHVRMIGWCHGKTFVDAMQRPKLCRAMPCHPDRAENAKLSGLRRCFARRTASIMIPAVIPAVKKTAVSVVHVTFRPILTVGVEFGAAGMGRVCHDGLRP